MEIRLRAKNSPIGRLEDGVPDFFRISYLLDSGCRLVYSTDSIGVYRGRAYSRDTVRQGWSLENGQPVWKAVSISAATLSEGSFRELSKPEQISKLSEILEKFPWQEEIPLLDEEGKIDSSIERVRESALIDWKNLAFPEELQSYEKIYLSSLGNDDLMKKNFNPPSEMGRME